MRTTPSIMFSSHEVQQYINSNLHIDNETVNGLLGLFVIQVRSDPQDSVILRHMHLLINLVSDSVRHLQIYLSAHFTAWWVFEAR